MISFDTSLPVAVGTGSSTQTRSLTVASGDDRVLIVWALTNSGSNPITGITYNGAALTKLGSVSREAFDTEMWYLVAPDTGTHDLVLTATGTPAFVSTATVLQGVDQTTPFPNTAKTDSSTGSTISDSVQVDDSDSWIFAGTRTGGKYPNATGTNYDRREYNTSNGVHIGDTNGQVGSTGSTTVSVGLNTSDTWAVFLAEIKAASGAAPAQNSNFLGLL